MNNQFGKRKRSVDCSISGHCSIEAIASTTDPLLAGTSTFIPGKSKRRSATNPESVPPVPS